MFREIFCKKLVAVDVGNEISVVVTGKRTLRDRAERCECAGQGGNTPGLAQNGCLWNSWAATPGPGSKGQGLMGRGVGGMQLTYKLLAILPDRERFPGCWKPHLASVPQETGTYSTWRPSACSTATPGVSWAGLRNKAVYGGAEGLLGQHDPLPAQACTSYNWGAAISAPGHLRSWVACRASTISWRLSL